MAPPISAKQLESIADSDARINLWVGAVRSGKTFGSILKLITLLKDGPVGDIMILGASRESIQRNVIGDLCRLLSVPPPPSKSNEMRMFGRTIYLVGAHDERAVQRIQGSTLAVAYVDEVTVLPAPVFTMLLSRLSVPGAQLLGTCNPAGPMHWLKKGYIDRSELNLKTWSFTLDDNPSLSEDYKADLKREYTGMWYKRYILGEWAAAEGLVYDGFGDEHVIYSDPELPRYYIAGVDYGITNPTVCLLAAVCAGWPHLAIVDEYYWDNTTAPRAKTDHELARDIRDFIFPRAVQAVYVDPSAASLKIELQRNNLPVFDAAHDVVPGIRTVQGLLNHHKMAIHERCKHLIEEMHQYAWDSKSSERGEDKPIKANDHAADALRYLCYSHFPDGDLTQTNDVELTRQARMALRSDPFFAQTGTYH